MQIAAGWEWCLGKRGLDVNERFAGNAIECKKQKQMSAVLCVYWVGRRRKKKKK
jgi:hypothetical protein